MIGRVEKGFPDDLFIIKRYTSTHGISPKSGAQAGWTVAQMGYSNPVGYVPIGVSYIACNHSYLGLSYFTTDAEASWGFGVRNGSKTDLTSSVKPVIDIAYVPENLVEIKGDTTGKPFKTLRFVTTYSLSNTTSKKITAAELGLYVPIGYQIFSIVHVTSGAGDVSLISFDPFNSDCVLQIRNASGASVSSKTAGITVSYIRNDFAEQVLA